MNNRDYKPFAPGEYYHVYNRGNNKAAIFRDAEDYKLFLRRLSEALYPDRTLERVNGAHLQRNQRKPLPANTFSLVAYCLMPNHFHFLLRQNTDLAVSVLVSKVCGSYSKLFNKKYKRVGSLFQDQFKAVHVDDDTYLKWLSTYIHQNPTAARLAKRPEDYPYSSYKEYVSAAGENLCDKTIVLGQFKHLADYKQFVSDGLEQIQTRQDLKTLLID